MNLLAYTDECQSYWKGIDYPFSLTLLIQYWIPMKRLLMIVMISATMAGCSNEAPAPDARDLYCYYSISAEEGGDQVVTKMVFTKGKQRGRAVSLKGLGKVLLDGEELQPDSTLKGGVYYESRRAMEGFEGRHTISLVTNGRDTLHEVFQFRPFRLKEELPAQLPKKPFVIALEHAPPAQELQLIMIDTSFNSKDVNEEVRPVNGNLGVTENMLHNITAGPAILEIHMERTTKLRQPTLAGGHMTVFYSLKREIELTE